jgi:radical SAM superfamily enzyme YgiQ (UPF0313 family)
MRVCLISPLSVSDFVDPELTLGTYHRRMAPQLGILCLAATLLEDGVPVDILNLDQCFFDFVEESKKTSDDAAGPDALFKSLVRRFEASEFDVYGFGSICSSYPLTLRLAEQVKRLHPRATVVVGGPQASVVDRETIATFPFVDYVIRGEADTTLPRLVAALSAAVLAIDAIPGITFRRGGDVVRNATPPVIDDLDALPLPAFHLDPHIHDRTGVHLEIGRGCPFTCTFCSTNDFFRRNFRLKSPQKMLDQMREIKTRYGVRNFSLVHDMYTVNRKEVVAFCEALLASGEDFIWSCSARTDCIDDELITLMARAGCRGIFFGIETGSARLQKVINKKLDLAEATERIRCADRNGITTAVALITAFPDETRDDLRDTIHYFVRSMRFDHAEPQMSLLAPLAETPLSTVNKDRLVFDNIFSDMSHQGWRQDPEDVSLIRAHPDIFPNFYAIPTQWLERRYFRDVHDFVTGLACWFRWLPLALVEDRGDLLEVFDRWQEWRAHRSPPAGERSGAAPYHNRIDFPRDFVEFVQACYLHEMARARDVIAAIADVEGSATSQSADATVDPPVSSDAIGVDAVPFRPAKTRQVEVDVDYKEIIGCLRRGSPVDHVERRHVSIVFIETAPGEIDVRQLSDLAAYLLRLCDGHTRVKELIDKTSRLATSVHDISPHKVCWFGLVWLYEQGLVRFAAPAEDQVAAA